MILDLCNKYSEYVDFLPIIKAGDRVMLREKAKDFMPMWEITLKDFFACCGGDFSCVLSETPTLWQMLWVEAFPDFVSTFLEVYKRLTIEPTAEQKQAAQGCLPVEWQEGILIFSRSYFGLPNFAEAERLKLADYVLAKKHDYNTRLSERNMQQIQMQKIKRK
jgi:hypothetical protein